LHNEPLFIIFAMNLISTMAPRKLRPRKISTPPIVSGMKPYGPNLPSGKPEVIFMRFEEYEALRLCDHEGMNHQQASVQMDVSRPTLTRICRQARKKVATALAEGKQLIIEGGKVYFDSEWHACAGCGCFFNHPDTTTAAESCALCGSKNISRCENNPEDIG